VYVSRDGDLYGVRSDGGRVTFWRRSLENFDAEGVPQWGHEERSARVMRDKRDPRPNPYGNALERCVAELAPDVHVLFDPANSDEQPDARDAQFHLAAVRRGEDRWLWRASPASGRFDFREPDGVFDSSHPWYAGMAVSALGDHIVYNYHGEGWHNAGQANQFLHWYRDGLFVGQFGVPNERGIPPAAPGLAGNSFSIQLVQADGALYLWHNDENAHAGLHRWRLDGVEWMRELTARGTLGETIELSGTADSASAIPAHPVSSLVARESGGQVHLSWKSSTRDARAIEIQRLQPTYVGPRFESIALLAGDAQAFVDAQPLPGERTVYRVRARFADGVSDYSNHVHMTARARPAVLESQNFETPPPELRDDYHMQPTPDVQVGIVSDPANPANHVLRVFARRSADARESNARVRWTASRRLFEALDASLARPRGSRPDLYRVELRLRFLQAHLGRDSEVSMQVDAGADLFSTSGRRQSLTELAAGRTARVSFTFAALPNGAGPGEGLRQYRSVAPESVAVAFPISLRAAGDVVEFLVDDVSIARLDPDTGGAS
jgi:hypothetical protein